MEEVISRTAYVTYLGVYFLAMFGSALLISIFFTVVVAGGLMLGFRAAQTENQVGSMIFTLLLCLGFTGSVAVVSFVLAATVGYLFWLAMVKLGIPLFFGVAMIIVTIWLPCWARAMHFLISLSQANMRDAKKRMVLLTGSTASSGAVCFLLALSFTDHTYGSIW